MGFWQNLGAQNNPVTPKRNSRRFGRSLFVAALMSLTLTGCMVTESDDKEGNSTTAKPKGTVPTTNLKLTGYNESDGEVRYNQVTVSNIKNTDVVRKYFEFIPGDTGQMAVTSESLSSSNCETPLTHREVMIEVAGENDGEQTPVEGFIFEATKRYFIVITIQNDVTRCNQVSYDFVAMYGSNEQPQ